MYEWPLYYLCVTAITFVLAQVNETWVKQIVSPPIQENWFPVADFNKLNETMVSIARTSCDITKKHTITTSTTTTTTTTTTTPTTTTTTTTTTTPTTTTTTPTTTTTT